MFRSVTSRLTFICIFLFGTLFICQLVLLYGFMRLDMKQHANRMLFEVYYRAQDYINDSGIDELKRIVTQRQNRENEAGFDSGPGPMSICMRVIDNQNNIVFQSQDQHHWSDFPIPPNLSDFTIDQAPILENADTHGPLGKVRFCIGRVNAQYILQVAHAENNFDPFFEHFIKIALILLPITLILVGLAGWFVSRQAMDGVKQVTSTASSINKGNLDLRVEVGNSGQEIKDLASNFNTMLAKIQALIRELEDVTNNIAHDLRSPLTRMRGIIETTLRDNPTVDSYNNMSAQLIEEIERLQEMINTMLQIASAEAGIDSHEMSPVNLNQVLADAAELFTPMTEDKQQQLVLQLPDQPVITRGSLPRLQRVIANLLDNATKFTPQGGMITLRAFEPEGQTIRIEVQDTGPGIDPAIQEHIFDRFYRGDQSRTYRGNGLGLSYVQSIVQAHQGTIQVTRITPKASESATSSGSIFTIKLPAANA
ncbi:MAG: sensor histidine kinase [Phycisphaeraceae bacterium JB051]